MANLRLSELARAFGRTQAVRDVTLEVPDGALACLLGPSGCGKTTTLRIVAGLEVPDQGEIWLGEREISRVAPQERHIGMMFQGYALYPHLSVQANIAYPLRVRGMAKAEREARVRDIARLLSIEELLDRGVDQISGGQQQRAALARAIVQSPQLFLLDEPLSNLDAEVRARMRGEIKRIQRTVGTTAVVVTHDQLDALSMADLVVLMNDGRIEQVGSPSAVYDEPANLWVASFIGEPKINLLDGELEREGDVLGVRVSGGRIPLSAAARAALDGNGRKEVTVGIRPTAVRIHREAQDGRLAARVSLAQPQGPRIVYELELGGELFRAEVGSDVRLDPGDLVHLEALPDRLHVFEPAGASGRRLT